MYHNYFGLNEQAFSIAVNPRYLYMSQQHKEALAHLLYGVKEGGFVMLSGEVGTGKTTIIRCLLEQLPENTEIAIILNPMADIKELLCTICDEFNIPYNAETSSIKSITDLLQQALLDNHQAGKNTILLIDEAQLLSAQVLEQIRLLTNLETSTKKLLQIILVGQPELNELLAQPRLRQLSQRITARFHLTPLTLKETSRYISHRLSVAGMPEDKNPFSARIIKRIHHFTGGIPRMINVLCERTLVGAYGHNKSQVDSHIFSLAKKEVEGHRPSDNSSSSQHPYIIYGTLSASAIIGLGIIFLLWQLLFDTGPISAVASSTSAPSVDVPAAPEPMIDEGPMQNIDLQNSYDIADSLAAKAILFKYLKLPIDNNSPPCWQLQKYACATASYSTWDEVLTLNRPAVLSLINSKKFTSNAVLLGLQDNFALLSDKQGEDFLVPLEELGPLWTGEVFYIWRKPKNYRETLKYGDINNMVSDIAEKFALLDQQSKPLATRRFNRALQERVKLFQQQHELKSDGLMGEQTLMKLNESLGLSTTLNTQFLPASTSIE